MTIAILAAMTDEISILKEALLKPVAHAIGDQLYYSGQLSGREVVLMQSGIGRVNAAMSTSLLLQAAKPSAVINTGTAGGLHADLRPGDVVLADRLVYHDVDNGVWGYAFGQVPQMPAEYLADAHLNGLAQKSVLLDEHKVMTGLVSSGESFVASDKQIKAIREHFPDICAVDMESTAVAQVCYHFKTPVVVMRAISDTADHKAALTHEEFLPLAAKTSSEAVLRLLTCM